mgnify:CR=1 FL=1
MKVKDYLKTILANYMKSHAPIRSELLIPACAQGAFESALSFCCRHPYVLRCSVENGIYEICVEHVGYFDHYRNHFDRVISAVRLGVLRFYSRHGLNIQPAEIHIYPAAYGFVIHIALNHYGLETIMGWNREQYRTLEHKNDSE